MSLKQNDMVINWLTLLRSSTVVAQGTDGIVVVLHSDDVTYGTDGIVLHSGVATVG